MITLTISFKLTMHRHLQVPGIANMPDAVTFGELMMSDTSEAEEWRQKLMRNAHKNGRPHFGWQDFADLSQPSDQQTRPNVLFSADVKTCNEVLPKGFFVCQHCVQVRIAFPRDLLNGCAGEWQTSVQLFFIIYSLGRPIDHVYHRYCCMYICLRDTGTTIAGLIYL